MLERPPSLSVPLHGSSSFDFDIRSRVIQVALSFMGSGYRPEFGDEPRAWCSGFVIHCLKAVGLDYPNSRIETKTRGRYLVRDLYRVKKPQLGDIAVLGYSLPDEDSYPHYSLVFYHDEFSRIVRTIDGGNEDWIVRHCTRDYSRQVYFSISGLIENYYWTGSNP